MEEESPTLSAQQPDAYNHPTMALKHVRGYTSYLSGKIKTIIDAAIEDPQRRKAMKDLIHNSLWQEGYTPVMEWAQSVESLLAEAGDSGQTLPYFPFGNMGDSTPDDFIDR